MNPSKKTKMSFPDNVMQTKEEYKLSKVYYILNFFFSFISNTTFEQNA